MDIREIDRIVRRGAVYLSESLYEYWPTVGQNEIAERNISVHIARSFEEHGFFPYAEVHSKGQTDHRLDLLAVEPREGISVVCEFKRLYSGEKLAEMVDDLGRIMEYKELDQHLSRQIQQRYGLIAGTTWQDSYLKYWTCDEVDLPEDEYPAEWKRFDEATKDLWHTGTWGCHVLEDYTYMEEPKPNGRWHYLLYLLFEL